MSLVACTPVGSGQPASLAASTPTLSGPCAYTPTSSMSGLPMMACSDRRPMFPVVHWITRTGRSALVVLIGCSFAPVRRESLLPQYSDALGGGYVPRAPRVNYGPALIAGVLSQWLP